MDARKYEYQSEFARRYVAEGRISLILRLLELRFGPVSVRDEIRLQLATGPELIAIGERLLSASSVEEVLGPERG